MVDTEKMRNASAKDIKRRAGGVIFKWFNATIFTYIYSPVMSMCTHTHTHTEERQKHRDKTAASASRDVKKRQMSGRRDGREEMRETARERSQVTP